jgi:tetratricopeptide (TPR) repeat protein
MTSGKKVNSSGLYEELEESVVMCDTQDVEPGYTFVLGEEEDTFLPPETGEEMPILLSETASEDSEDSELYKYKEHQKQDDLMPKLEHENVSSNPRSAKRWSDLAAYYKNAKLFEQAIFANQKAVKLDPNSTQFLYDLGISYAVVGRHEEAIDCMERVIEKNEQHALAHATLGGYYKKMGLEDLAEQHIGIAMKNYIDDENHYNRACLEALRGNVENAVQLLRSALEARQINVEWVLRDPDLDSIRFNTLFKQLIAEFAN